jgi:thiamine-monophosphate kinase
VGDAALGLEQLQAGGIADVALVARYRTPTPRLGLGQALVGLARACADVSDGVLLDARNIAEASACAICIDLESMPLSPAFLAAAPDKPLLFAATAGDDYELLFTISAHEKPQLLTLSQSLGLRLTVIGTCLDRAQQATPLRVLMRDGSDVTPEILGFEH